MQEGWSNKISNTAQLGGIETSVLDNGAGRGTRIAWINTGSGFRFKVVLDRAMDIADAFFNEHSLAWISHAGVTEPFPASGLAWLKTFGGGLLTTCGLSHVGGPEEDEYGVRGLHGAISNLRAEVESIIQPRPLEGKWDMSITGRMKESSALGPNLELKRTVSATLGKAAIRLRDEVYNKGNTPAPHMLLYHFNLGWPLVDEGAAIIWKGPWKSRRGNPDQIFKQGGNYQQCRAPLPEHNGGGEEAAFIDVDEGKDGWCVCGIHNPRIALALSLKFRKSELPWLTNWQHWGHGEYVTGLEPGTHPPVGQKEARADKTLIFLQPGEMRSYDLELEVLRDEGDIKQFFEKGSRRP